MTLRVSPLAICVALLLAPCCAMAQYDPYGMYVGPENYLAAYQAAGPAQGPATGQPPSSISDPSRAQFDSGRSLARNLRTRGGRAANMFGDSLPAISHAAFGTYTQDTYAPVGISAAASILKIAENNQALTMDRVYFTYHYFHNAAPVSLAGGPFVDYGVSQYVLGAEKTLFDGLASVEVRGSMLNDIDGASPDASFDNGVFSNLTVNFKLQLIETEDLGIVGGLGVGVPTGSDFQGHLATGTSFALDNQAVYLLPFLGATYAPGDVLFSTSFVQLNTVANGDSFVVDGVPVGNLTPQTSIHVSTSLGAWLINADDGFAVQGVAWLNEVHYTTALEDPDSVNVLGPYSESIALATSPGRFNMLNVTSGVHVQINELTSFRVAGVFPIRRGADRQFDAEVQATLNRQF